MPTDDSVVWISRGLPDEINHREKSFQLGTCQGSSVRTSMIDPRQDATRCGCWWSIGEEVSRIGIQIVILFPVRQVRRSRVPVPGICSVAFANFNLPTSGCCGSKTSTL